MTLLTTGFFLLYLVAVPPHLVHHLFDGAPDHAAPPCPHFAQSHQPPELPLEPPVVLAAPAATATVAPPAIAPRLLTLSLPANPPRAPPATAPSA